MPKYMWTGRYTAEGNKGLIAHGGSARLAAIDTLIASVGGSVDHVYFGAGNGSVIIIFNAPDAKAVAAINMTVTASGAVHGDIVELLTPAELDAAAKLSPAYQPPGK